MGLIKPFLKGRLQSGLTFWLCCRVATRRPKESEGGTAASQSRWGMTGGGGCKMKLSIIAGGFHSLCVCTVCSALQDLHVQNCAKLCSFTSVHVQSKTDTGYKAITGGNTWLIFAGLLVPTLGYAKPVRRCRIHQDKTKYFKNHRKFYSCKRTSSERNTINRLRLVFRSSHFWSASHLKIVFIQFSSYSKLSDFCDHANRVSGHRVCAVSEHLLP